MPLLHKKPFIVEPIPRDLNPDEEVFLCQPTEEVFRDYESFFNRMFQCNSLIWSCSLTGTSNLTYQQALDSEKEAKKLIASLHKCYQKTALTLVHHVCRTNIKNLVDEICSFLRERFVKDEVVDMIHTTSSEARILRQVKIIQVITPPTFPHTKGSDSPIRVSVITTPPTKLASTSPQPPSSSCSSSTGLIPEDPLKGLTNGLSPLSAKPSNFVAAVKETKARTPGTPKTLLCPEVNFDPANYQYVVEYVGGSEKMKVKASILSRPKGVLSPKKLKMFLKNATFRESDRHPLTVKEEYVATFDLGESSRDLASLPSLMRPNRKRVMSQSKLDSFFSPNSSAFSLSDSFLSMPSAKKKRRSTPAKRRLSKMPSSSKRKDRKGTSRSPGGKVSKSMSLPLKSPMSKSEALKVLNKAKRFKQMDLKNAMLKQGSMGPIEMAEMRIKAEMERQRRVALLEEEKTRRKEVRLRRIREQQAQRRREKMRQKEWLKPREDTMCNDSKPLPEATLVDTCIPPELFGDAVMVLEFLNTFGPLFNIQEVIRGGITYESIEYAITTEEMDSLLYEIIKFLLQAIFAAMEEEHESAMVSLKASKSSRASPSATEGEGPHAGRIKESSPSVAANGLQSHSASPPPPGEEAAAHATAISYDEIGMGKPLSQMDEIDEERPLNEQVEGIKSIALGYSQWPFLTQHLSMHKLVIDAYTVTEVLRLHFLSCGGFKDSGQRSWFRHSRRGGYTDADDPSMALRMLRQDICTALAHTPVYSFSPADKLEVLSTLCSQLLTYCMTREYIEEASGRAKKARRLLKEIHLAEEKRKKERKKEEAKLKKEEEVGKKEQQENAGKVNGSEDRKSPLSSEAVKAVDTKCDVVAEQGGVALSVRVSERGKGDITGRGEAIEEKEVEDEDEKRRWKMEEEVAHHHEELRSASASVNLQPVGSDRHHRKYMLFPSMAGLFVEDTGQFPVEEKATAAASTAPSEPLGPLEDGTDSPKTNPSAPGSSDQVATADTATCGGNLSWSCFSSQEEIDRLIDSLNPRGIREGELKKKIGLLRSHFGDTLSQCIFTGQRTTPVSRNSAVEFFELYLREQILDIEEKIHIGNLGSIGDRVLWREAIENSGAAAAIQSSKDDATPSRSVSPISSVNTNGRSSQKTIQELANALLQVQAGMGKKFLMPPLGMAIDKKKKRLRNKKMDEVKESDVCLDQWRASLSKATSFSQIFLHLATLERAVMWSKSLMNVRCRICRRKCGDEFMLLCDGCDHGYHTYCLKPPLLDVPDGDWFCYDCMPVTPVKPRKRVQRVVIVEESSESEPEETESEAELEESEGEVEEEEVVHVDPVLAPSGRGGGGRGSYRGKRGRGRGRGRGRWGKGRVAVIEEDEESVVAEVAPPPKRGRGRGRPCARGAKRKHQDHTHTDPPMPSENTVGSRSRKKLKMDAATPCAHRDHATAENAIAEIIELRCSHGAGGKHLTGALRRELKGLEMQLCQALWEEVDQQADSWHFAVPVKKKEFPGYFDAVTYPMDLRTVKSHIKCGDYRSIDEFLQDMLLIFSNSIKFHKRTSAIRKAANGLKRYFEKRCSDLGLKDLRLSELGTAEKESGTHNCRRRSNRLKH